MKNIVYKVFKDSFELYPSKLREKVIPLEVDSGTIEKSYWNQNQYNEECIGSFDSKPEAVAFCEKQSVSTRMTGWAFDYLYCEVCFVSEWEIETDEDGEVTEEYVGEWLFRCEPWSYPASDEEEGEEDEE